MKNLIVATLLILFCISSNAQSFQIKDLSYSKTDDAYKQFSLEFFDLIVVDECHRGSAKEDSKWYEISKLLRI